MLLPTAEDQRHELRPLGRRDDERADPLRAAELVRGEDQVVDAGDADRFLAGRLRGIHVHRHAMRTAHGRERRHVLAHAGLVVDPEKAHERRVGLDHGGERLRIEPTVAIRLQQRDAPALRLQASQRREHRLVLGRERHEMPRTASRRRPRLRVPQDREIVGFRRARGEHDVARRRVHERRGR